jgi:hypothetical protein
MRANPASKTVYELRVLHAKGAEWLNQQLAGAIRKKLSCWSASVLT